MAVGSELAAVLAFSVKPSVLMADRRYGARSDRTLTVSS